MSDEVSATVEEKKEEWKRVIISPNTPFFSIFQKIIKNEKTTYPINEVTVDIKEQGLHKFIFDWQDENITGIEVYKKL